MHPCEDRVMAGLTKLFGMNVFTADLVASCPFERDEVTYDFGALLPYGITQWGSPAKTRCRRRRRG
jgi:hypothetical protein